MSLSMVDDNRFTFANARYRRANRRRTRPNGAEKQRARLGQCERYDTVIGQNPPNAEQEGQGQARPAI